MSRSLDPDVLAVLGHHVVGQLLEHMRMAEQNWSEYQRRYNSEVKRTNRREAQLQRLRLLHVPREVNEDGRVFSRCKHCIIGYDPKTDQFVNAIWPCETRKIVDGRESEDSGGKDEE